METWLLKFHLDKCKVLTVSKKGNGVPYSINNDEGSVSLKQATSEQDLDVTFQSNLKFDIHINEKVNTPNRMARVVRRLYKCLDCAIFVPIRKCLVRSHFDYATSVWSPIKKMHVEAIEKVQRWATKQLPGFKYLPYCERLRKLNLPTRAYRRIRGDMIETYKILNGIYTLFKI